MPKRKLTVQQRKRIASIQQQRKQKLLTRSDREIQKQKISAPRHGIVVSRYGRNLSVKDENNTIYHCLFRQNLGDICCGDRVVWEKTSDDPNVYEGVVTALLDRTAVLSRTTFSGEEKALAANISQIIIVLAPQPEPSEYLLDQYLVAAERIGVSILIAVNKADLLNDREKLSLEKRFTPYREIGYELVFVSSLQAEGLQPLQKKLANQTSILVGQSGVGKSSLTNAIIPDLQIQTRQLSEKSKLGQHTTSASTLYQLANQGYLIDSPGVRSFRLGKIDMATLENGFIEFKPYLGHCRFSNCSHTNEPGCALIEACDQGKISPTRLENFRHMASELS